MIFDIWKKRFWGDYGDFLGWRIAFHLISLILYDEKDDADFAGGFLLDGWEGAGYD